MQFLVLIYHNIAYAKISDCLKIAVGKNIKINNVIF